MDKIEVHRDHLMYLIRELNAVRRDKQDLAERVDHVYSCLCAIAGVDALKNDRSSTYKMDCRVNVNAQADNNLAGMIYRLVRDESRPGGILYRRG